MAETGRRQVSRAKKIAAILVSETGLIFTADANYVYGPDGTKHPVRARRYLRSASLLVDEAIRHGKNVVVIASPSVTRGGKPRDDEAAMGPNPVVVMSLKHYSDLLVRADDNERSSRAAQDHDGGRGLR
jgi:hypothetical protein